MACYEGCLKHMHIKTMPIKKNIPAQMCLETMQKAQMIVYNNTQHLHKYAHTTPTMLTFCKGPIAVCATAANLAVKFPQIALLLSTHKCRQSTQHMSNHKASTCSK